MVYELKDRAKAAPLFAGMEDSMIASCLQGMMDSKIYVTDLGNPRSAMAHLADFAFLAGEPDRELVAEGKPKGFVILVPPTEALAQLIEDCFPGAEKWTRYAIKKDTVFDRAKLETLAAALPEGYEMKRIDGDLYDKCLHEPLFTDGVCHFGSKAAYLEQGRGFVVVKDGEPVAMASSYTVYREGVEIEIDTLEGERRKGLATALGAALILSCLSDGLYPSWDAANMDSVRLAEKLGYEFSHEYLCYAVNDPEGTQHEGEYRLLPCEVGDTDYIEERYFEALDALAPSAADAREELLVFKALDEAGRLLGGCVLDIDAYGTAEFNSLWVEESYRRQGLGTALMDAAERAAREKGCPTILNAYTFDFQVARPLFEKLGYRLVGVAGDWPRGHEHYTLLKRLDGPVRESVRSQFKILPGTEADGETIADCLEAYNRAFAPRSHPYRSMDKKLVDDSGVIVGGCIAGVSGWDTLHIDAIWVDEKHRCQGLGSYLLNQIEEEARAQGAYLARTDTLDALAAFLQHRGYVVTTIYEDEPKWDNMQKRL